MGAEWLCKNDAHPEDVEDVLSRTPRYRFIETGDVEGEDLYVALGQTEAGRYLIVYFVYKATSEALIVSAKPPNNLLFFNLL